MKQFLTILSIIISIFTLSSGTVPPDDDLIEVELHMLTPPESTPKSPYHYIVTCEYDLYYQELYVRGDYANYLGTTVIITNLNSGRLVYSNSINTPSLFDAIPLPNTESYRIVISIPSIALYEGVLISE